MLPISDRPRPTPQPTQTATQPPAQDPKRLSTSTSLNTDKTLAQTSGGAAYHKDVGLNAQTSGTGPGGINYGAHVNGPSLDLKGDYSASVGLDGVDVKLSVDVSAKAAEAGANAEKTFSVEVPGGEKFDVKVNLAADGMVGADGKVNLNLHLGPDGLKINAGAEGFAGAKASLTGSISLSHEGRELMSGSATLSATAGVGAKAHADLDFSGGNVSFSAGAEATAGVGLGFELNGSVNAANTARAALEVTGSLAKEGVEWAADKIGDAGHWLGDHAGDAAGWVGDRFKDVGNFLDKINPLPWP